MTVVIFVPGVVTPGHLKFAPLVAELGSVRCEIKELEAYAGPQLPEDYSLATEVEGLHRFVSEQGYERFHLYGFSLGGAIALAYVAEHGHQVASVALDEPATDFTDDDREEMVAQWPAGLADLPPEEMMGQFVQTLISTGVDLGPPAPLPPGPEMARRPAGVAAVIRTLPLHRVDEEKLRAYTGPLYFSYGSLTNRRWESMAARMQARFPRCTVERYEGRHHLDAPHQSEPARVAAALRELWTQQGHPAVHTPQEERNVEAVVTGLGQQHGALERLLAPLGPEDWSRPSPDCPGWTVADVVLHLAQADEWVMAGPTEGNAAAAARMAGGPASPGDTTDDTVDRMVAHERGAPAEQVFSRWRASSSALREFFLARDPREPLPWIFGDLPARTLATTRLVECWIHTRDVANALGTTAHDGDQLWHVARLAWRTLPFLSARAGLPEIPPESVRLDLTAPVSGDRWTFGPDDAPTSISGTALDFCLVAARRVDPSTTALVAGGPDADSVLSLVRTWG